MKEIMDNGPVQGMDFSRSVCVCVCVCVCLHNTVSQRIRILKSTCLMTVNAVSNN